MKYTYTDIVTDKLHYTNGDFRGWTTVTRFGKSTPHAVFDRGATVLWIPVYLLTSETKERIPQPPVN